MSHLPLLSHDLQDHAPLAHLSSMRARCPPAVGEAHSVALLRDVVPLKYGKTTNAIFGVSKDLCVALREQGATGIAISQ